MFMKNFRIKTSGQAFLIRLRMFLIYLFNEYFKWEFWVIFDSLLPAFHDPS
jgi:hypothetical protein